MSIIGADIGRNTALAVIEIDGNLDITNIDTYFLDMNTIYGSDIRKKEELYKLTYNIVYDREPIAVGLESPFMSRFPKAYGLLSEFISTMELAIYKAEPSVVQYRVSPKEGKSIVNAASDAKEDMYRALLDIEELEPFIHIDMNEHEIDSIAIAYWVLQRYRREPGLFLIDRYR